MSKQRLLCLEKIIAGCTYYSLPGGLQAPGETLEETVQRECREEIGINVTIGELAFICPHYGMSFPFLQAGSEEPAGGLQTEEQLEFIFACEIPDDYVPANGFLPDRGQRKVLWIDFAALFVQPFVPPQLPQALKSRESGVSRTFWPYNEGQAASAPLRVG